MMFGDTAQSALIPFVSLFSGAMGLDLGLEQAGFEPLVVNDVDSASVLTCRVNRPDLPVLDTGLEHLSLDDFSAAAGRDLRGVPLIAGGPPCQAFSIMGRRRGVEDERGTLIFEFIRLVAEAKPAAFLMENVRGLHSMSLLPAGHIVQADQRWKLTPGSLFTEVIEQFEALGYRVDTFLVNSANYGAPQVRERMICIGNRHGLISRFPEPQFSNRPSDGLPPFTTLAQVIGEGFVDPDPTLMNFSARKLKYLAMVPPGGNWRSLPPEIQREAMGKQYFLKGGRSSSWRRLSWDFPSPTVHTLPNHATTSMCHPGELRALTVGECAAIQEFPRDWAIQGRPAERYRQVGNAVPVRLGRVAGHAVRDLLERIRSGEGATGEPSRVSHLRPHVRVRSWWKGGEALAGSHSYVSEQTDQISMDLSR